MQWDGESVLSGPEDGSEHAQPDVWPEWSSDLDYATDWHLLSDEGGAGDDLSCSSSGGTSVLTSLSQEDFAASGRDDPIQWDELSDGESEFIRLQRRLRRERGERERVLERERSRERDVGGEREDSGEQKGPYARNWVFTCNNPRPADWDACRSVVCEFIRAQEEKGEEGTTHIQGCIQLEKKCRLGGLRKAFTTADGRCRFHFECMRGTPKQARDYCSKEETRVAGGIVIERGSLRGGQGSRTDLAGVVETIASGATEAEVFARHSAQYLKYHGGIRRAISVRVPPRRHQTLVYWFFGSTGTGKSRAASELAPMAYWKAGGNKWFDGYEGHEDIIFDDARPDGVGPFNLWLKIFDRYPCRVEFKGGSVELVAKRIFVTTNKSPKEMWQGRTDEELGQLYRRIHEVRWFHTNGDVVVAKDFVRPIVFGN